MDGFQIRHMAFRVAFVVQIDSGSSPDIQQIKQIQQGCRGKLVRLDFRSVAKLVYGVRISVVNLSQSTKVDRILPAPLVDPCSWEICFGFIRSSRDLRWVCRISVASLEM
jgi:hypothetical protein